MRSLFAVALLAAGCATTGHWGGVAERQWIELRDADLVFTTDLSRDTALERFRELQRLRAAVIDHFALVVPTRAFQMEPFPIVHMASCSDLRRLVSWARGFVTRARDFSGTRLMMTCDTADERSNTLVHELVHVMSAATFPRTPSWLTEGLAEYYETMRVVDEQVVLGHPPGGNWQRAVTPLGDLLALDHAGFYRPSSMGRNYSGAWRLVHLLNSPKHRPRFLRYLDLLRGGGEPDQAWAAVFGGIDLAPAYAAYGGRMQVEVYRGRLRPAPGAPPRERRLGRGEVHALWLHLLLATAADPRGQRAEIDAQLADIERDDPTWPGRHYWKAVHTLRLGGRGAAARAEKLLRAYVAEEPRDERAWTGLVQLGMARAVRGDADGITGEVPAGLAAIEPDVLQLVAVSSGAHALNLIGWYYALLRRPRVGLSFAYRAIRADTACGACHDTLALLLYHDGRPRDAVTAQERAIALMSERGLPPDMRRRLEIYRKAASP